MFLGERLLLEDDPIFQPKGQIELLKRKSKLGRIRILWNPIDLLYIVNIKNIIVFYVLPCTMRKIHII